MTCAQARRLLTDASGRRIAGIEIERTRERQTAERRYLFGIPVLRTATRLAHDQPRGQAHARHHAGLDLLDQ